MVVAEFVDALAQPVPMPLGLVLILAGYHRLLALIGAERKRLQGGKDRPPRRRP